MKIYITQTRGFRHASVNYYWLKVDQIMTMNKVSLLKTEGDNFANNYKQKMKRHFSHSNIIYLFFFTITEYFCAKVIDSDGGGNFGGVGRDDPLTDFHFQNFRGFSSLKRANFCH